MERKSTNIQFNEWLFPLFNQSQQKWWDLVRSESPFLSHPSHHPKGLGFCAVVVHPLMRSRGSPFQRVKSCCICQKKQWGEKEKEKWRGESWRVHFWTYAIMCRHSVPAVECAAFPFSFCFTATLIIVRIFGSGFVEADNPYGTSGQKGTYYFEFSRPLRTMDRLQQVWNSLMLNLVFILESDAKLSGQIPVSVPLIAIETWK